MHLTTPSSCLVLLWQVAATVATAKHGTIGMGITMYKPVCGYACHDSLSTLYLNCTTFDDSSDMSGMDMDMPMGTTSDECYQTNEPWLQTLAYCMKERCAADGVGEAAIEKLWGTLAANGLMTAPYSSMIPAEMPKVELEEDAEWLNETSLVNGDLYFATHQTLNEFEYQEDTHVRLS